LNLAGEALLTSLRSMDGNEYDKQKHSIFHSTTDITGEHAFETIAQVVFPSPKVERLIMDKITVLRRESLLPFAFERIPELSSFQGKLFEYLGTRQLTNGGSHATYRRVLLDTRIGGEPGLGGEEGPRGSGATHGETRVQFPLAPQASSTTIVADFSRMKEGVLYMPESLTNPSWDAAVVADKTYTMATGCSLCLFQFKHGKTKKNLSLKGIADVCRKLGLLKFSDKEKALPFAIELNIVIPPDTYEAFQSAWQYQEDRAVLGEGEVWPTIVQYKMCLDVNDSPA